MSVKIESNLDGFKKLKEKIKSLPEKENVKLGDLFNDDFMQRYTSVSSFDKLFEAGGFDINSKEDFDAIPDDDFDSCIRQHTSFSSWEEMKQKALNEYIKKKLEF